MKPEEKHEFWTKAFLAALSGFSSRENKSDKTIAERAEGIANEALKIYIKHASA